MNVILLNGPSSAGKSSIAKALKDRLQGSGEWRIIALDNYMTLPTDEPIWEDDVFDVMPGMCTEIARALADNQPVIVDHVMTSQRIYNAVMDAIGSAPCLKVLVTCDREVLLQRDKSRGDRFAGSAEASMTYLYPKSGYSITVDSSKASPEQIAEKILVSLQPPADNRP